MTTELSAKQIAVQKGLATRKKNAEAKAKRIELEEAKKRGGGSSADPQIRYNVSDQEGSSVQIIDPKAYYNIHQVNMVSTVTRKGRNESGFRYTPPVETKSKRGMKKSSESESEELSAKEKTSAKRVMITKVASPQERKDFKTRKEAEGDFWGQPRLMMREGVEYPRLIEVNPKNIPEQGMIN